MLIPVPVLHAASRDGGPSPGADDRAPAVVDVALSAGGVLRGQITDAQGNPVVQATVSLRGPGGETAATVSDRSGFFQFAGLRGGTYRIVAGEASGLYRLWAPRTAPPSAQAAALVVAGNQQVLGQCAPVLRCLRNPWIIAGIVAAAIAIPIAIHNTHEKSP